MRENILDLKDWELWLQQSLQQELQLIVPLRVDCAAREQTIFIAIHVCESSNLLPSIVLPLVENLLAKVPIL
jgi:hypothetical protein